MTSPSKFRAVVCLIAVWLTVGSEAVFADGLRDPTVPPTVAMPSVANPEADTLTDVARNLSIIIRDGKRFVVKGTRLYAEGQMLEKFRIERIAETEIWLREGSKSRIAHIYSGISRKRAAPVNVVSADPVGAAGSIKP